jgi:hypothetical protein
MINIQKIQSCFIREKVLYTKHSLTEMEAEELGLISDEEIHKAILSGKIIEEYLNDRPYPSILIYGRTNNDRPIHIVAAYNEDEDTAIIITVYQPDPDLWINSERRK